MTTGISIEAINRVGPVEASRAHAEMRAACDDAESPAWMAALDAAEISAAYAAMCDQNAAALAEFERIGYRRLRDEVARDG